MESGRCTTQRRAASGTPSGRWPRPRASAWTSTSQRSSSILPSLRFRRCSAWRPSMRSAKRPVARLLTIVGEALQGGASIVQLRDKGVYTPEERSEAARGVRSLCDRHDAPFLVNDDPELARRFRADGVHVGRQDPSPRTARLVLGPRSIVGVTVYGNAGEEEAAAAAGADYMAVGPFSPSPTKPEEPVLPLSL